MERTHAARIRPDFGPLAVEANGWATHQQVTPADSSLLSADAHSPRAEIDFTCAESGLGASRRVAERRCPLLQLTPAGLRAA